MEIRGKFGALFEVVSMISSKFPVNYLQKICVRLSIDEFNSLRKTLRTELRFFLDKCGVKTLEKMFTLLVFKISFDTSE